MTRVLERVRSHLPVLLLALIVAGCTAFPQLVAEHRAGDAYYGIHPVISDDELFYLAREHEVLDGHPFLGSSYLAEYKSLPGLEFWIPDGFVASVAYALGNLHTAVVLLDFLLPVLLVLVTYAIIFSVTSRRLLSTSIVALLYLGLFFDYFNRMPNPQLTYVLFLLFILAVIRTLKVPSWKWATAATIAFSALFYSYTFSWTLAVVIVVVVSTVFFLVFPKNNFQIRLLRIGVVGVCVAVPYFFTMYMASKTPYYHEALLRIGLLETHFPSGFTLLSLVAGTLATYFFLWRMRILALNPLPVLLLGFSISSAIAMNQHLITGKNFQFAGHYTMPGVFLCVFALAYAFTVYVQHLRSCGKPQLSSGLQVLVVSLLLVFSIISVTPRVLANATPSAEFLADQRYAAVLEWLDTHTAADATVFASQRLSQLIPVYTHNNVFFSTWAQVAFIDDAEVRARYIRARYFDPSFTREDIMRTELDIYGASYMGQRQHLLQQNKIRTVLGADALQIHSYPEEDMQALLAEWEVLKTYSFTEAFERYRLEYVVWDKKKDPAWNISRLSNLEEVFDSGDMHVYKVQYRND